jgi:alcohol dehydrogenase YqhD (iron-dependent ADH family)
MELMIQFDFSTSPRILFRLGAIKEIGKIASEFGNRVLLVMGKHLQVASAVRKNLIESKFTITEYIREGEPTDQIIKNGVDLAKSTRMMWLLLVEGEAPSILVKQFPRC